MRPTRDRCPFCDLRSEGVIEEAGHAFALPDAYPVTEGHTLVIPRLHVRSLFDLDQGALQDVWVLVARVRERLMAMEGVEGVNVGVNDGEAAGQTVPHAHVHIIPRRRGDVPDPRGGVRWIVPGQAAYWES